MRVKNRVWKGYFYQFQKPGKSHRLQRPPLPIHNEELHHGNLKSFVPSCQQKTFSIRVFTMRGRQPRLKICVKMRSAHFGEASIIKCDLKVSSTKGVQANWRSRFFSKSTVKPGSHLRNKAKCFSLSDTMTLPCVLSLSRSHR